MDDLMHDIGSLTFHPLRNLPLFDSGMSVGEQLAKAIADAGGAIRDDDILVVAQKIVSKAEGRHRRLRDVEPGLEALRLAAETGRPPQILQLMLDESAEILRAQPAAVIARHRTGHVLANAGIDASNIENGGDETVLLWPTDPDRSAREIRRDIERLVDARPAVLIADSMGRAWRMGTCGTAIGCAGLIGVDDRRGQKDLFGRALQATLVAIADSLAAAAVLVMGEGAEGTPAAIVRGAGRWVCREDGPGAVAVIRPREQDMFL